MINPYDVLSCDEAFELHMELCQEASFLTHLTDRGKDEYIRQRTYEELESMYDRQEAEMDRLELAES